MSDIAQTIQHKYPRNDLDTDSFVLENAEPLQDVVGTLAPGAHGSGPGTVNGQDAYTGQLVPVRVWSGSAEQENVAGPLRTKGGLASDIDGATWVIEGERWSGSAQQDEIAAPLLAEGGSRTSHQRHRRSDMGDRVVNAITRQLGTGGPDDNHAQAGWLIEQETDG